MNVRKFSFAERIINDWNQLPTFLIESPADILTFKTKLDILWNAYIDFTIYSYVSIELVFIRLLSTPKFDSIIIIVIIMAGTSWTHS